MAEGTFGGREVVIVEAARLPIGRGHEEKGYYKDIHPSNAAREGLLRVDRARRRSTRPRSSDVVTGCVQQFGEQGLNIGRNAWLEAGLPIEMPGDHDRPPVRLGPAGDQLRRRADRLRRPRRRRSAAGVEHMGHISFADGFSVMQEHGLAVTAAAARALRPRPAGAVGAR